MRVPEPPFGAQPFADEEEVVPGENFTYEATAEPESGGVPLEVQFTLSLEDPPPGLAFTWDFGDGSQPTTTKSPSHTYRDPGEYTAALKLQGPEIDELIEFNIEATEHGFDVDIEADPDIGPAPLTTSFKAVLFEEIEGDLTYEWDFGDGSRDSGRRVKHTYVAPGAYTAVIVVTNRFGQRGTKDVEIQVDEPEVPDEEDAYTDEVE